MAYTITIEGFTVDADIVSEAELAFSSRAPSAMSSASECRPSVPATARAGTKRAMLVDRRMATSDKGLKKQAIWDHAGWLPAISMLRTGNLAEGFRRH
jgi:hypothetical protein